MNIPIPSDPRTITSNKLFVLAIGENGEVCKVNTDGYPVMRGTLNCETGTLILEPKRGEWVEREVIQDRMDARIPQWQQARCSVCGKWHTTPYMYCFDDFDYCPNCGAKMEVPDGDEKGT